MKFICVEGSIGAGKSTLLPLLAAQIGYVHLLEPVDQDPIFREKLQRFTSNPKCVHARNDFQMYMTNQRFELLNSLPEGNYLIERSLLSDLVFTHACMSSYEGTPEEAALHMESYRHLIGRINDYPKMDACLYLKTSPVTAYQRMLGRGRKEEKGTPLSYMVDVSNYHDAVLPQVCRKMGTKLVTVNWDYPTDVTQLVQTMLAEGVKL